MLGRTTQMAQGTGRIPRLPRVRITNSERPRAAPRPFTDGEMGAESERESMSVGGPQSGKSVNACRDFGLSTQHDDLTAFANCVFLSSC